MGQAVSGCWTIRRYRIVVYAAHVHDSGDAPELRTAHGKKHYDRTDVWNFVGPSTATELPAVWRGAAVYWLASDARALLALQSEVRTLAGLLSGFDVLQLWSNRCDHDGNLHDLGFRL